MVRDEAWRPLRLWGTIQDVTEQIVMEQSHREAVHQVAQARADLETEHAALQLVQRALLPASVPVPPGAELAVAYLPVQDAVEVGGDWYDAFTLPDGHVAVAVGDVAGHDLRAATVMGQVRNALRAYAMEDPRPGHVLMRANTLLMALPDSELVTAVFGVYNPATHSLRLARAGHPQPLTRIGGRTTVLDEPRGIVLGAVAVTRPYDEVDIALGPGDALLLYTDGLVERRGSDTLLTTERLCALVDAVPDDADADGIVDAVTRSMIDPVRIEDDVCLLVLHRPIGQTPVRRRRSLARRDLGVRIASGV
jgi:serine phosphatase RsbU (regulator of sigma subunit)